jgi:glycosyltransferase involved in cell wall biosynthesis
VHNSSVSVIIPTFNHASRIERALNSVFAQDLFNQITVYVSDDCSSDTTFSIASKIAARYANVHVSITSTNAGWYGNYMRLLDLCETEFVAILEGDDYWTEPTKLARQLSFLQDNPAVCGCFCDYDVFIQETGERSRCGMNSAKYHVLSAVDLIYRNYPGTLSTCFYRSSALKQVFERVGKYLPVYDWAINATIADVGGFGFLPGPSAIYEVHSDGLWNGLTVDKKNELFHHSVSAMRCLMPQFKCFIDDRELRTTGISI